MSDYKNMTFKEIFITGAKRGWNNYFDGFKVLWKLACRGMQVLLRKKP